MIFSGMLELLFILVGITSITAGDTSAVLSLESLTFDKVIKAFKVTLVKFDKAYVYGEVVDEYSILAKLSAKNEDLLVAEVGVNEYGERENQDLAERYQIDPTEYPQYRLFRGELTDPVVYSGSPLHFDLIKFLRRNGIYVGLDGCIEELDELVSKFMDSADNQERRNLIYNQLQAASEKYSDNSDAAKHANIYEKLMKSIIDKGNDFIPKNIERLSVIINGKNVSETKKENLTKKVNILKCFLLSHEKHEENTKKDEL